MTKIILTLYVIGKSVISKRAIKNLKAICARPELKDSCQFTIIDLVENPGLSEKLKILATPLLIKSAPQPNLQIIGDLKDAAKVLSALALEGSNDEAS